MATQSEDRQAGLDVPSKAVRAANYHHATMKHVFKLIGAAGIDNPTLLNESHIVKRRSRAEMATYAEMLPPTQLGSLLTGEAPEDIQKAWNNAIMN